VFVRTLNPSEVFHNPVTLMFYIIIIILQALLMIRFRARWIMTTDVYTVRRKWSPTPSHVISAPRGDRFVVLRVWCSSEQPINRRDNENYYYHHYHYCATYICVHCPNRALNAPGRTWHWMIYARLSCT